MANKLQWGTRSDRGAVEFPLTVSVIYTAYATASSNLDENMNIKRLATTGMTVDSGRTGHGTVYWLAVGKT